MQLMLDTNVLNLVADGRLEASVFKEHELFVTDVQEIELSSTTNDERRRHLLSYAKIITVSEKPATAVFGDAHWGRGAWRGATDELLEQLVLCIKELDAAAGKKPKDPRNQPRDARIAETAIRHKITLVTNDKTLREAAIKHGCHVLSVLELLES